MRCTVRPFMMELFLFHRLDGSEGAVKFKGLCMVEKNLTGLLRFFMVDLNFHQLVKLCTPFSCLFKLHVTQAYNIFSLIYDGQFAFYLIPTWMNVTWWKVCSGDVFFTPYCRVEVEENEIFHACSSVLFFSTLSPRCFWSGIFEQVPPFFPTSNGALRQGVLGFALFIYGPFTCNFF